LSINIYAEEITLFDPLLFLNNRVDIDQRFPLAYIKVISCLFVLEAGISV